MQKQITASSNKTTSKQEKNATTPTPRMSTWLVVITVLLSIMSTNFFLTQMRVGVRGWFCMNICAPSVFLFYSGYFVVQFGPKFAFLLGYMLMVMGTFAMTLFGTYGLFVFSWKGPNLIAQVSHIFMTLSVFQSVQILTWHLQRTKYTVWCFALALCVALAIHKQVQLMQMEYFESLGPNALENFFQGDYSKGNFEK